MIWWLLACITAEPPAPGELARYREALVLAATEPEAAAEVCLALPSEERQGACLNDVQDLHGHFDAALCRRLPARGWWRDECLFTASESLDPFAEERLALCGETGTFEPHCLHHTWSAQVVALVEEDGLLVDKVPRLAALRARWVPLFTPYDADPAQLIDDWFWFRYHQKRDTVTTRVCQSLAPDERARCEAGTVASVRRLLHDRSRGSGKLRPSCAPTAAVAEVELLPYGPKVGDDPRVLAAARAWLDTWCASGDRGARAWVPDFDPQSDAHGGPVAGTIRHR